MDAHRSGHGVVAHQTPRRSVRAAAKGHRAESEGRQGTGRTGESACRARTKHPDEALEQLQKAIELNPRDAKAQGALGSLLAERGQIQEAIPDRKSTRLN